ncbi:MAG: hypothetical protein AABZ44_00945, partial [Elusimicrobiota bacterium]
MFHKLLSLGLSFLVLCQSTPLRAARQERLAYSHDLASNPERALKIEQEFFDGAVVAAPVIVSPVALAGTVICSRELGGPEVCKPVEEKKPKPGYSDPD